MDFIFNNRTSQSKFSNPKNPYTDAPERSCSCGDGCFYVQIISAGEPGSNGCCSQPPYYYDWYELPSSCGDTTGFECGFYDFVQHACSAGGGCWQAVFIACGDADTEFCEDNDHDGYYGESPICPVGNDCDDDNADVNPGAVEICDDDTGDENCNGYTNCEEDSCASASNCLATPTPIPTPTPTPNQYVAGGCLGDPIGSPPTCSTGFTIIDGVCQRSLEFQNRYADPDGYDSESCTCPDGTSNSPIVIDVDHSGFSLTDAAGGVDFDILAYGYPQRIS